MPVRISADRSVDRGGRASIQRKLACRHRNELIVRIIKGPFHQLPPAQAGGRCRPYRHPAEMADQDLSTAVRIILVTGAHMSGEPRQPIVR